MKSKYINISLFIVVISLGCSSPEQVLTKEELKLVDSIYHLKMDTLEPSLVELCDSIHEADYPKLVDSLKMLRQREILDIINK